MKKLLVVLGSGFAAFTLIKRINLNHYSLTVISERNHFLFTPLMASTTVGTIEFRSIIEPVRLARKELEFIQARCLRIDPDGKAIHCENIIDQRPFSLNYDVLVAAVGAVNNTFGVEGVSQHALFLKELRDARKIRQRIIDAFEQAATPNLDAAERARLLHFVVVGGGPTGVEFAAELSDFLEDELTHAYPHLAGGVRITLIEAGKQILNSFDAKVSEYAARLFNRRRVTVLTNHPVQRVSATSLLLADGTEMPYGLLVWSTGNGPTDLARSAPFKKDTANRILTDPYFGIIGQPDLYAIGDCACMEGKHFPATAQVAMQSGKYLARLLNASAKSHKPREHYKPFQYKHLGMLAYIGDNRAVADLPNTKLHGFVTWLFWRSVYLTRLVGLKNKVLVLFDWVKAFLFGRDVSRF